MPKCALGLNVHACMFANHEAIDASSSARAGRRVRGSDLPVVTERPEPEHAEMRRSYSLMELAGFEPATFRLRTERSTN